MNTHTIFRFLLISLLCFVNNYSLFSSIRSTRLINSDWKFKEGAEANAYSIWLDDSSWQTVQLPHDASIGKQFNKEYSTSANGWLPFGEGWYRKDIVIAADEKVKKVFYRF